MAEYTRGGLTHRAEQFLGDDASTEKINTMFKEVGSDYNLTGSFSQYLYKGDTIAGRVFAGEWVVLYADGYATIEPNDFFRKNFSLKTKVPTKAEMAEHVATLFKEHKIYWCYDSTDPYDSERLSRCDKCGYIDEELHPEKIVIEYVTNMLNDERDK